MLVRLIRPLCFQKLGGDSFQAGDIVELTLEEKGYGRIGRWWVRPESYVPHFDMDRLNDWANSLVKDEK